MSDFLFTAAVEELPFQLASALRQKSLANPAALSHFPRKSAEEFGLVPGQKEKLRKVTEFGGVAEIEKMGVFLVVRLVLGLLVVVRTQQSYPSRALMADTRSAPREPVLQQNRSPAVAVCGFEQQPQV